MTEISLYNTRTRSKERFVPIDRDNVRMYVCGPTVYDRAHIGNARPVVVFDVLYRLLRHVYGAGHVTYVRNVTDVDDKINARAAAEKRPIRELTDETIGWYHADMGALGVLAPDHEPRATEYHPADGGDDRDADRAGACLCGARARALQRGELSRLRALRQPLARRDAGRRAGRGRALQARPDGLRAVEAVEAPPSRGGRALGATGGRGGISSARRCRRRCSGPPSTSMAGGSTSSSRTTRTRSRRAAARTRRGSSRGSGCTTASSTSRGRRCRSRSATSSPCGILLDQGVPGEVIRLVLLSTHYRQPMDWTARRVDQEKDRLLNWRSSLATLRCMIS